MSHIRPSVLFPVLLVAASFTPKALSQGVEKNAKYTLVSSRAAPGEEVTLPLMIWADGGVEGYSFSLDFDEEVLRAEGVDFVWERPDGLDPMFQSFTINNENDTPGNDGVDEGFVGGAHLFGLDSATDASILMPANIHHVALRLHFQVKPETVASSTEIVHISGAKGETGPIFTNVVTIQADGADLETVTSYIFVNGHVIIDDISAFVRGDSNGDSVLDLSDAVTTLDFLFSGSEELRCPDAADYNDDGKLDIVDPIGTLHHLYQGGPPPAPPSGEWGEDPTPDLLDCSR